MKFTIHESRKRKLVVSDPLAPDGRRAGRYFISFPHTLADKLPGSIMLPEEFAKTNSIAIDCNLLTSNHFYQKVKVLDMKIKTTELNVFHGSFSDKAVGLGEIALAGFAEAKNRAAYQKNIFQIMKPFLHANKKRYDLWVVEDCLASGDTLIGVLSLLKQRKKVKDVRIDVVVATTIGTDLLIDAAEKLDISLKLNVGFFAYGLSQGEKSGGARLHANYITYPHELINHNHRRMRSPDGNIYVVGDMGDGAKSMSQKYDSTCPWNKFRDDPHGERYADKLVTNVYKSFVTKKTIMYFSNGGYLLRSFVKYLGLDREYEEKVISAKRVWSDDKKYGYGVLLDEI